MSIRLAIVMMLMNIHWQKSIYTFLTIENNNMNNYIVTFEYRVMVTAFAILAMFFICYI